VSLLPVTFAIHVTVKLLQRREVAVKQLSMPKDSLPINKTTPFVVI
jgi:hypothetical protein